MVKINVITLRDVLSLYEAGEISFIKLAELLNEDASKENDPLKFLRRLVWEKGSKIMCSSSCSYETISQAQADGNFLIDDDHFGYVFFKKDEYEKMDT